MVKYTLSPQAQSSLQDIRAYTLENFGKQQTTAYLKMLQKHMKDLAASPAKGKERNATRSRLTITAPLSGRILFTTVLLILISMLLMCYTKVWSLCGI